MVGTLSRELDPSKIASNDFDKVGWEYALASGDFACPPTKRLVMD